MVDNDSMWYLFVVKILLARKTRSSKVAVRCSKWSSMAQRWWPFEASEMEDSKMDCRFVGFPCFPDFVRQLWLQCSWDVWYDVFILRQPAFTVALVECSRKEGKASDLSQGKSPARLGDWIFFSINGVPEEIQIQLILDDGNYCTPERKRRLWLG